MFGLEAGKRKRRAAGPNSELRFAAGQPVQGPGRDNDVKQRGLIHIPGPHMIMGSGSPLEGHITS